MAKAKKTVKKTAPKAKKRVSRSRASATFYGVEHEFIIITGGGFLVVVLGMMLFLH